MIISELPALPCHMVNDVANNTITQCKFIIDNNCLEDEALIDYVYLTYCDLGVELRFVAVGLIAFLVIILFLALSAVADEFLCPSLLAVAKNLRMSDNLAGVTLLAFGNGCPDIFASLAAASDDRSELIIGELLGAGIFCTSIVAGLIFIHSDFKIASRPLLRDATFYLMAVYLIWTYCCAERITFYGSLAFIVIYVIYLIVALSGQALHSRLMGDYAIADKQQAAAVADDVSASKYCSEDAWLWRSKAEAEARQQDKLCQQHHSKLTSWPQIITTESPNAQVYYKSTTLTNDKMHNMQHTNDNKSSNVISSLPASICVCAREPSHFELQLYASVANGYNNAAFVHDDDGDNDYKDNMAKLPAFEHSVVVLKAANRFGKSRATDVTQKVASEMRLLFAHIAPIKRDQWAEASLFGRLVSVLRVPLYFAALVTVPVVDRDKPRANWCRPLNALHCITVPVAVTWLTRLGQAAWTQPLGVPIGVWCMIPGAALAVVVYATSSDEREPSYQPAFAYVGFVMSILWIYLLATEIISLLKTVGIVFSMTDTAIGLGILAWGNSLGDIVANLSLAEAGYPRMALGASIGAPLLNLLLGFGLSFTVSLRPGEYARVQYSPILTLLCGTLALILISLMLSTLVPPFKSRKPFGYMLIVGYGVYFALAVCFESKLIDL